MLLYVALGSAIGGVARYLLGGLAQRLFDTTFPVGTLIINVSGSLLLGAFIRYATETPTLSPDLRAFLTIGLCGGYTTFSTFSFESVRLMEEGAGLGALANLAGSVAAGLAAAAVGLGLGLL